MAGTWRISVEAVEALRPTAGSTDSAKQDGTDEPPTRTLVVEVSDGRSAQRTKPFEVPEDGRLRVSRVLFIPAPGAGTQLVIRAIYAGKNESDGVVGEAALPAAFGGMQVELFRRQRRRGILRINISDGLPSPPPGVDPPQAAAGAPGRPQLPGSAKGERRQESLQVPVTPPSVSSRPAAASSFPASTPTAGGSSRPGAPSPTASTAPFGSSPNPRDAARNGFGIRPVAPGPPGAAANARPLRMRFPGLPFIGNVDVTIEGSRLPQSMPQPFFIIGLEGQEFLAEDTSKRLKYTFQMGSARSNVAIYCYDAKQTHKSPLGRVLLPIADVLWAAGDAPDAKQVWVGFEKDMRHFQQQYALQFLPANEAGDSHSDPTFIDMFEPHLSEAVRDGANRFGAFGQISVSIEVTFRNEVSSLMGFYLASIVAGAKAAVGNQNAVQQEVPAMPPPSSEDASSMNILESPALRSLLGFLWRFKHYSNRPSMGFTRFIKEQPHRGYVAAVSWFLFCMFGFFPCSAWIVPIYIWLACVGNAILASFQRQADWACKGGEAKSLFWKKAGPDSKVPDDPNSRVKAAFACTIEQLQEVEPMVRRGVIFLERVSNLLSFADGPASIASFIVLGGVLGAMSLSLLIISNVEGLSFLFGAYGAFYLVMMARQKPPALPAQAQQGWKGPPSAGQQSGSSLQLFNQAFTCVPDQAEVAHRFVASRVQRVDR